MYISKNCETCFVGFLYLRSTQEKYCFACYFYVDLSIVLSCKSEFNAYLFVYCQKNLKLNFVRLLVRCSFQWCNLFTCFLAVYQSFSLFSYALSENGLIQNFVQERDKMAKTSFVSFAFIPSIYDNFLGFVQLSFHAFSDLSCLGQLKIGIFMINTRKMFLLQNQFS